MNSLTILAFAAGVIIYNLLAELVRKYLRERREEKFLRFVRITLPNARCIEVITTAPTDKKALENIERKIREASRTL